MNTNKPTGLGIEFASAGAKTPISAGRQATGFVAEIPTYQDHNWLFAQFSAFINHVNEQGIAAHDAETNYPVDAWAKGSDGQVYVSRQTPNMNQDPTSVPAYWELLSTNLGVSGVNLSYAAAEAQGTVINTAGNDVIIPAATPSLAGLLTAADKTILNDLNTVSSIISSGSNANGSYRVWSDGVREQWGQASKSTSSADDTFNFPVAFTAALGDIAFMCTPHNTANYGVDSGKNVTASVTIDSTTGWTLYGGPDMLSYGNLFSWYARG